MTDNKPIQHGILTGDVDTDLQLTTLDRAIDVAMEGLATDKQRKFVEIYGASDGSQSATSCAIAAGYKGKNARVMATENIRKPNIALALKAWRTRHALVTGIPLTWKRQQLVDVINIGKSGDKPQLMAVTRAIEVLAKLDGELEIQKHQGSGGGSAGTVIVVNTGIPERPAITVEGEVVDQAVKNIEKHNEKHNDD